MQVMTPIPIRYEKCFLAWTLEKKDYIECSLGYLFANPNMVINFANPFLTLNRHIEHGLRSFNLPFF